jgi:hypothetical protein
LREGEKNINNASQPPLLVASPSVQLSPTANCLRPSSNRVATASHFFLPKHSGISRTTLASVLSISSLLQVYDKISVSLILQPLIAEHKELIPQRYVRNDHP